MTPVGSGSQLCHLGNGVGSTRAECGHETHAASYWETPGLCMTQSTRVDDDNDDGYFWRIIKSSYVVKNNIAQFFFWHFCGNSY